MKITLELTGLELNALSMIVNDRVQELDENETEQWEDVATGEVVTISHLNLLLQMKPKNMAEGKPIQWVANSGIFQIDEEKHGTT